MILLEVVKRFVAGPFYGVGCGLVAAPIRSCAAGAVHGNTLDGIYGILAELIAKGDVLVRERAFTRFSRETQALFKAAGIADLAAWRSGRRAFDEISPKTVKKL